MSPKMLVGVALLGFLVLVLGGADSARAQTFNPTLEAAIINPEPGANSDYTVDFDVPEGDVNFAGVVSFIPGDWGITPGDEIPIGAIMGNLTTQATLGLFNNACNNVLPVNFTFLNSSIDINDTLIYEDSDDNNVEDFAEDKDGSGITDAFEKYPDFINRVIVDENDQPQQPIRRAAGITYVAGQPILLQFLIFEPGTFIDEEIPFDEELGYPSVVLLLNAGDPEIVPEPSPINDFCSPLSTVNTSLAISKDNPCTDDDTPVEELDPLCETTGAPLEVPDEATTIPDESGHVLFTNPQDGTYTFTTASLGQRDADGDGYENYLDTCALVANEGEPRIGGDGDFDEDGLDAACDPNDNETNSDEDLDGYVNRQDNCPLVANGENEDNQHDEDEDLIGDACDPDPDDADAQGTYQLVVLEDEMVIGTGEGPGGPPEGDDGAADGDDDGGGGALIIIIVVVIAAVVVVGGGAFFLLRRGGTSGGGGAAA